MNRSVFGVLAVVCFGAGWWIDSISAGTGNRTHTSPDATALVAGEATIGDAPAAASFIPHPKPQEGPASPVTSMAGLLKLIVPARQTFSRARIKRALDRLTAAELASLAAEIESLGKRTEKQNADLFNIMPAMMDRWLTLDVVAAMEFGCRVLEANLPVRDEVLLRSMERLFQSSPATAERFTASLDARELYIDARVLFVRSLQGLEARQALAEIVAFDGKTRNELMGAQYLSDYPERWAAQDPQAAMNWALGLPPGVTRRYILYGMARGWGTVDPKSAREFVENVPASVLPQGALRTVMLKEIARAAQRAPEAKQ